VLRAERPDQAIIFARTKIGVDRLARALGDRGVRVKALHGDMSQGTRDGVMLAFKGGRERLLVATDVAARGLDITGVTHIINYDVPNSPDIYVHRIGRTGRVGRSGRAITLVTPKQRGAIEAIERHANTSIAEWSEDSAGDGGPPEQREAAGEPQAREREAPAEPARGRRRRVSSRATDGDGAGPDDDAPEQPRRPRHTKPRGFHDGRRTKLVIAAGREHGLEPADVIGALVDHSHLEGEDIEHVRVLERFSFAEVPADRAGQVVEAVTGRTVKGIKLRMEVASG
jgi:ATP-dependent RNA helicase DeaD